jgi:citrate lyase beta subunit
MPGTDWRKIEKAAIELDADSVCMDLEDGVALNAKDQARETIVRALETLDFGGSERLVRVNEIDSGLVEADLAAVLPAHPDGIVVPKVRTARHVAWVHDQISSAEARFGWPPGGIPLLLIIESARGLVFLEDIISATHRTAVLIFGAEDYAGDIGAVRTKHAMEVLYARSRVVAYAKAFNLQAIDIVFADFGDDAGFRADALQGMVLGYTGKQLIHPAQVPLVHDLYTPKDAEIARARRIVEAHEAHQAEGTGAFALDGRMVDAPVVKQAESVLERARAAGKLA